MKSLTKVTAEEDSEWGNIILRPTFHLPILNAMAKSKFNSSSIWGKRTLETYDSNGSLRTNEWWVAWAEVLAIVSQAINE